MILRIHTWGPLAPIMFSLNDLYFAGGPEYRPKRKKLKGYQKCKKKK